MLEDHAKTKICPFMLSMVGIPMSERRCIGSDCMGWDWYPQAYKHKTKPDSYVSEMDDWNNSDEWELQPQQGDCGMKPPEELNANVRY